MYIQLYVIQHPVDDNNSVVLSYVYDSWGTLSSTVGVQNPFLYKGYYFDFETSLYYCHSRYYNPMWRRWLNADSVDNLDSESSNGLNLFAYCGNNPIMGYDPSGKFDSGKLWGVISTIAIAAVVIIAIALVTVASGGSAIPVLIGAGIGAGISGISSAGIQLLTTGEIDVGKLFLDMSAGAVMGAFGGSAIGKLGMAFANSAVGFTSSIGNDLIQGNEVNFGAAAITAVLSFGLGLSAGPGVQNGQLLARKALNTTISNISSQNGSWCSGLKTIFNNRLSTFTNTAINSIYSQIGRNIGMTICEEIIILNTIRAII